MWYLIRRNAGPKVALRYCDSTSRNPDFVFQNKDGFDWTDTIHDFTSVISVKTRHNFNTINELLSDGHFTIIPLLNLPIYISSINDVISAYPELFL